MTTNTTPARGPRHGARKRVALAAGAAILALAGIGAAEAPAAEPPGTPVELRFVLKDPLPRGWDLRITSDTPDAFRSAYVDCQIGPDGVPDDSLRCEKRRYSQRITVPEGQRFSFEFALVRPSGRETVVKQGVRRAGDDPILVRAYYERPER
jgi:hypothetical protein